VPGARHPAIDDSFRRWLAGGKNSLVLGATGGVIGIVVGVVSLTGLGTKFPGLMLSYSGGYLFFALILTAIAGYVIGMGVTITATYILLSVIAGPALVELGKPLLTAHLIVFWFCEIGGVTFNSPFDCFLVL
jgi:TRAP-type uncharacterized transport system fused permease subunit